MPWSRRRALQVLAVAGAGVGVASVAVGARMQPRFRVWVAARPDLAAVTQNPKHVVVIGGGLAGMSTAMSLLQRGHRVTVLEAGSQLGGKVSGWEVDALGERFPVEHGFHGFFRQYVNLRALLGSAGVDVKRTLAPLDSYAVAVANAPHEAHAEHFGGGTTVFPFNLVSSLIDSKQIRWSEFRHAEGLIEMMRYGPHTHAQFDHIDFATFMRTHQVPPSMQRLVLAPFGEATLNRIEQLSTAEAMKFFHFYFFGNPLGLAFDVAAQDSGRAIVAPLVEALRTRGAQVRTQARVHSLVRGDDGGVTAVSLGTPTAPAPLRVACEPQQSKSAQQGDTPVYVSRNAGKGDVAFDLRCTHQGCPVAPQDDGSFRCPCHGGVFDRSGTPVGGPPKLPLRRLPILETSPTHVVVGFPQPQAEVIACDACVIACDTKGAKQVLRNSDLSQQTGIDHVGESEPYAVLRLWLDKAPAPHRDVFYTTSQFRLLDSFAWYSRFQEPHISWAARTGNAVVELHAYAIPPHEMAVPEVLAQRLIEDMNQLLPEMRGARVLHQEMQLQDNFSRFGVGDHAPRPSTSTSVPGLWLAGDWVRVDAPVALMEGAVVSGLLAANAIVEHHDKGSVTPAEIITVDPCGPLASTH
jgi:carotenoid phi-ring synthase / carotenoid chi-ring synthase